MKAVCLAQYIINTYSPKFAVTNLKINKLLYYIQVEALRTTGSPTFDDDIEAWDCGPVVPSVYHAYQNYGTGIIPPNDISIEINEPLAQIVQRVVFALAPLTAYDLVSMSHKQGGAWNHVYQQGAHKIITTKDMLTSNDRAVPPKHTLAGGIAYAKTTYPNALRLLQNS